jgi:pimeloyl-ACP methyl ester carboxylesterase
MFPDVASKLALVNPIGLEDWQKFVGYVPVGTWYENELKKTPDKVKAYMTTAYFDGQWKPEYDVLAELQMGWTESPDYKQIAWVSALTYDMIYTQPVVHDFPRVTQPTLLIIGDRDRTALGRGSAPPEVAAKMGLYGELGKKTRDAIPNAKLVELKGIGHIPQYEAYEAYMKTLIDFAY